jgi:hypothetical protein
MVPFVAAKAEIVKGLGSTIRMPGRAIVFCRRNVYSNPYIYGRKGGDTITFMSDQLIELIEKNADKLTDSWLRDVQKHPATPTYHVFDRDKLYQRAFRVYSQLGKWLSRETTKDDIRDYYTALGRRRQREGFALSEVIQALIITRRHVWLRIEEEGLLETSLDLHKGLELTNRVIVFFDRAILYTALGYEGD